jgi:hypothetical protein
MSEHKIKFPSSIPSPFCYTIKLQVSLLLLPLSIHSKKRGLGALKKDREKKMRKKRENKGKRTNVQT